MTTFLYYLAFASEEAELAASIKRIDIESEVPLHVGDTVTGLGDTPFVIVEIVHELSGEFMGSTSNPKPKLVLDLSNPAKHTVVRRKRVQLGK